MKSSLNEIKVLLSPCHYVYEEGVRGSEYGHAFDVADIIASHWPSSIVITGKVTQKIDKQYKVVEVQPSKTVYDVTPLNAIAFSLRYTFRTYWYIFKGNFDVLHHVRPFQLGLTFNLVALIGLPRKTRFVVGSFCSPYVHQVTPKRWKPLYAILHFLSNKTLQEAAKIYVYDDYTKDLASEYVDVQKIEVIPPSIDGSKFFPSKSKRTDTVRFLAVGYLINRKRFDLIIEMFKILKYKKLNVKLTIIGDGPEKENLEALIVTHGLSESVSLKGFIPNNDLPKHYQEHDIFVSLQEAESFGQVYIEAMASGMPIITTDNVGSRQIITDNFGVLIPIDQPEKFIEVASRFVNNRDMISEYSLSARRAFENKYEKRIIKERWISSYIEMINNV